MSLEWGSQLWCGRGRSWIGGSDVELGLPLPAQSLLGPLPRPRRHLFHGIDGGKVLGPPVQHALVRLLLLWLFRTALLLLLLPLFLLISLQGWLGLESCIHPRTLAIPGDLNNPGFPHSFRPSAPGKPWAPGGSVGLPTSRSGPCFMEVDVTAQRGS